MTKARDFKRLVRERMARTGERYTTARAHLVGEFEDAESSPALALGGVHDQTAALRDLLVAHGYDAPHTKAPPSEALLLGLGGGIGAAVFTFQVQGQLPHLYVETRCTPQFAYDFGFLSRAAAGLGVPLDITTGTTPKAAQRALDAVLAGGSTAICSVDAAKLPHHAGRGDVGSLPWVVVVHEQRGDTVLVTDRSRLTIELPRADFEAARLAFKKGKASVAIISSAAIQDAREGGVDTVRRGVLAGVRYCVHELVGREVKKGFAGNFGLRAIEKWIGEIEKPGKEGWRVRFAPGKALAAGLRQGYGWIETNGTGGGAFRALYADFLREAASITGNAQFGAVAEQYDALSAAWTSLFASLMPDGTVLGEMRRVLHARSDGIRRGDSREEGLARERALDALVQQCDPFPTDAERTYVTLADGLRDILAGERAAAKALGALVE